MITFGMTAGNDNAIIWIVELETSSTNYYFCAGHNLPSITLDTGSEMRVYSNKLQRNSLGIYPHSIPAESAGGMGSRNGFQFVIAGFGGIDQNDFYPATSAPNVLMSRCKLGFIWTGATETNDITWLIDGEVENYESRQDGVYFDVTESNFLEYVNCPPYSVQKDINDLISYFPQSPKDTIGKPIPIVYGAFNIVDFGSGKHRLTPALLVNPSQMQYLGACHKFDYTYQDYDTKDQAFIYANGFDTFLELLPSTGVTTNNLNGYNVKILPSTRSSSQYVKGRMTCWLKVPGEKSDVTDLDGLINEENPTELTLLDDRQIQFLFTGEQTDQLGVLSPLASNCSFDVYYTTSVDGEQRTIQLSFYNPIKSGGAGYSSTIDDSHDDADSVKVAVYEFGNYTGAKADTTLPWKLSEILQLGFTIKNVSGATGGSTSGDIIITGAVLTFTNISVYNFGIKNFRIQAGFASKDFIK